MKRGDQLCNFALLLSGVSGLYSVLNAVDDMVAENFFLNPAQRCPDRRDLCHDVDAIAVFVYHTGQAADLALDSVEAFKAGRFGLFLHP